MPISFREFTNSTLPQPPSSITTTISLVSKDSHLSSFSAGSGVSVADQLSYLQCMIAGAVSRTMAQTLMHPANTYKTVLQLKGKTTKNTKLSVERLLRGVDAQFLLSLPHGAFHFFVIDQVKEQFAKFMPKKLDFISDFASSTVSTIICSIVSTPQMVLTDRLMADVYPSFPAAMRTILRTEGVAGFYAGWWPALAQKIPSYGLTWVFFQQLKKSYQKIFNVKPSNEANFIIGAVAAAGSVIMMNPMDTIKTRLVTQPLNCPMAYKGVTDCFIRIVKEEGITSFYRSLAPRLLSVVPMIAIQFGVYELMKSKLIQYNVKQRLQSANRVLKTNGNDNDNNLMCE
eukprot:gene4292-6087_t